MVVVTQILWVMNSLLGESTAEGGQGIGTPAYIDCKPQVFIHLGDLLRWAGVEYPTDAIVIKVEHAFPDVRSILFSPPTSSTFGITPLPPNILPVDITLDVYLAQRRRYCPDEHLALVR